MGMTETRTDVILREGRVARRLGRLFKIEGAGGFERRPVATVQRLIERRDALVKELQLLDGVRRSLAAPRSAELDQALGELAREVYRSLHLAETRLERLGRDLRIRRGEGLPTGIRGSAIGHLLGRG
jgi:hypothetical protein